MPLVFFSFLLLLLSRPKPSTRTQYSVLSTRLNYVGGRLNYVGGEISPETDLSYTKILFETLFELQCCGFFVREYSPEADFSYTRIYI